MGSSKKGSYQTIGRQQVEDVERGSVRYSDLRQSMDEANEVNALINPSYQKEKFEFPFDKLVIREELGGGHFGTVFKGFARGIKPRQVAEETEVAVKTTKSKRPQEIEVLMLELALMSRIGHHNNVVNLLGACTENVARGELYVIMELCPLGSLDKILDKHKNCFAADSMAQNISLGYPTVQVNRGSSSDYLEAIHNDDTTAEMHYIFARERGQEQHLTLGDLVKWSIHVAKGMRYISDNQFLHGDLAARNILIAGDGTAKISDFGLGKSMYQTSDYHKKERLDLPYRWLAPECLKNRRFSIASDVWAYGVVLWEIFTLGDRPFAEMRSDRELLRCLMEGERLPQPDEAPPGIFEIMSNCWKMERTERPTFENIEGLLVDQLRRLTKSSPTESIQGEVTRQEGQHDEDLQEDVPELTSAEPHDISIAPDQITKIHDNGG